ncbi:ATP-binding protein [Candidatus Peregrinibacteria bacterium]|nr:ATP-binding protein [Candidatus Peregrinibacteria bacterium]
MATTSRNTLRPIDEKTYVRRRRDLVAVFPPDDNTGVSYPPDNIDAFMRLQHGAPALNVALQHELFALLAEYERKAWIVQGDRLYDSQRAHVTWAASSLCRGEESPSSLLIEGPAGTGKTRVLGILMQALVRLQLKGILQGAIAFTTAKAYHLTSKTVGLAGALHHMLATPPNEASPSLIRGLRRDLKNIFPDLVDKLLPPKVWAPLFEGRTADLDATRKRIRDVVGSAVNDDEGGEQFLDAAALLLCGRATTVTGIDDIGVPELLSFPDGAHSEEGAVAYAGDAAFALPRDYPVYARQEWNVLPSSAEPSTHALPRVLLTTSTAFRSKAMRLMMPELIADTGVVLCDEARQHPAGSFQDPVMASGKQRPLVIGATSINYGRKWDRVSPSQKLQEAIGVTLPSVRVNVFPSKEQMHYPAESHLALEQLLDQHFKHVPSLPRKQPWEMDMLFITHPQLTREAAKRLRQRYEEKTELDAQVYCFDMAGQARAWLQANHRKRSWRHGSSRRARQAPTSW